MSSGDDPFVPGARVRREGAPAGPLRGLTFAVKDLFDVAGVPTGGGNPDWPGNAGPAAADAWVVARALEHGAALVGKTVTDEVSLGILGENAFYGTPRNPRAPGRVPGGSSSGSASAVAAGACDFAFGSDTGGSVRVPASFCGLYGLRPTHGRVDTRGMMAQAPSSDTAGWLARDAEVFGRVGEVLLAEPAPAALPSRLLVAVDAFGVADEDVREALRPAVAHLGELIGSAEEVTLAPPGLSAWARAQRTLQPHEGWLLFKDWIDRDNPRLAFSVARNLVFASQIPEAELQWAAMMRLDARARLGHLLPPGTVLCMPTTPFPAPAKGLSVSAQDPLRTRIACLCSPAGLTGVCQVSLPAAESGGAPVGLSVVAGHGEDMALVAVARAMAPACPT